MRHKKLFYSALLVTLFLSGAILVYAGSYLQHALPNGKLLEAMSFTDGSALTFSYRTQNTMPQLVVMGYHADGTQFLDLPLLLQGEPETIIAQVCGVYAQVFIGYPPSIEAEPETAFAERFVLDLPPSFSAICFTRVYLPTIK